MSQLSTDIATLVSMRASVLSQINSLLGAVDTDARGPTGGISVRPSGNLAALQKQLEVINTQLQQLQPYEFVTQVR